MSIHFCGDDDTAELVLRTIISVNQLSVYGAVADMCDELAWRIYGHSECTRKLVAQDNSETTVIPTELTTTNKSPRANGTAQGNLLQNYKQIFANIPEHLQIIKLCSNVGVRKTMAREQYFTTDLRRCGTRQIGRFMSRVYFTSRQRSIKVKRWIRGNTKIGPALEVAISHHQGRYGIEIMVNSLFGDGTCSWVMIVNGTNKYETEVSEGTQENHIDDIGDSTGKFVAKAGPKQTPIPTTSSSTATLPYHQRDWIDVEPGPYDKSCFEVSKKMIRLLRHDPSVFQEEDGAVEFRILAPMFRSERLLSIGQFEHG